MSRSQVLDSLALMVWFGAGALFGLAILKDFRGMVSNYEARFAEDSSARKQARSVSRVAGWLLLIVGSASVVAVLVAVIVRTRK